MCIRDRVYVVGEGGVFEVGEVFEVEETLGLGGASCGEGGGAGLLVYDVAVSYTHLDVYKRQQQIRAHPGPLALKAEHVLLFQHCGHGAGADGDGQHGGEGEDVYKRQQRGWSCRCRRVRAARCCGCPWMHSSCVGPLLI